MSSKYERKRKRDLEADTTTARQTTAEEDGHRRRGGRRRSRSRSRSRSPSKKSSAKRHKQREDLTQDRRDSAGDRNDESLSIGETNKLRAKLGLVSLELENKSSNTQPAAKSLDKEVYEEAKIKIQERIKELGFPLHQPSSAKSAEKLKTALRPEEAIAFTELHMKNMERINEMKSKIAKGVSTLNLKTPALVLGAISSDKLQPKQEPMAKGQLFSTAKQKLEAEIKERKAAALLAAHALPSPLQKMEPDSSTADAGGPAQDFLDPRLHLKPATRQRRHFEFKQPGEYEKLAKMQRSKAKLERLQSEIEKAAKQTGISSAVKLAIVTPSGLPESSTGEYIPEVEWWDEVVVGNGKGYTDIPSLDMPPDERYASAISDLVEHPIQLKPPDEPLQPQYLKASLTKKERKKMRRQNRREALKEKSEKVRLGLEKPPDAKLKISNLMRVLGTDAVQDPTKMEAIVRKQMAEREQKHVEDNRSRKLTRDEKVAKAIRKVAEDTTLAVHVTVFKLKSLANPAKKFKVMMNAKQLQMTGCVILLEDINVVVMEGGPKQQKFYKNLMLNRIKWAEEIAGQRHVRKGGGVAAAAQTTGTGEDGGAGGGEAQQSQGERNQCTLIWEGIVQKRAFYGEPRFVQAVNHKQARELLDKHGVAHYWDLCYATTVLLSDDK